MKLLAGFLLLLFLALQAKLWLGDDGVPELWRLGRAVEQQRDENAELKRRNDTLEAEVQDLKEGSAALEERARSELGMIKADEQLIYLARPDHRDGTDSESDPDGSR